MSLDIAQDLLTVADYERLIAEGRLTEHDRVELIEGKVVEMSPVGGRHARCVRRLNRLLSQRVADRAIVGVQDPVRVGQNSEPEPDLMLLRPQTDDRTDSANPSASDLFLVIEVSDSTLADDRNVKGTLYAQAGIPEYWIVNLPGNMVEIYTTPQNGVYQQIDVRRRGETLAATTLPDLTLRVEDIL